MAHYEVIIGNVGTVYSGTDSHVANTFYATYEADSRANYGRAAGEPVTLLQDGEPIKAYDGTLREN